ncbi:MAG: hypothetical protein ACRBBK_01905 [Paracoccaceae bacterium]
MLGLRGALGAVFGAGIMIAALGAAPLNAQSLEGKTWRAQKCVLYQAAVRDAIALQGDEGLSAAFLAANARFMAGGCELEARICLTSPQEFELANMLTIMTMNEGMASTFVPFGC